MSKAIYTREDLLGLLVALFMAGVQPRALQIFAAALCIEWWQIQNTVPVIEVAHRQERGE